MGGSKGKRGDITCWVVHTILADFELWWGGAGERREGGGGEEVKKGRGVVGGGGGGGGWEENILPACQMQIDAQL